MSSVSYVQGQYSDIIAGMQQYYAKQSDAIYRTGVLMYGKRPSIKGLVKAMKANKV